MKVGRQELIFVLGILHRSGTNFLRDLLCEHPDCAMVQQIGEDYLLAHADILEDYVDKVSRSWNTEWDREGLLKHRLQECLAQGSISWLASITKEVYPALSRYLVTKTPSVRHLRGASMFPESKVIVLVRDGRAVVESGIRSFGWPFEQAVRAWANAAEVIAEERDRGMPFLLVRYEDLVQDLRAELQRIFEFLGIDSNQYDFKKAENLPVKGSSTFGRTKEDLVWTPTAKNDDFTPLERYAGWSRVRHERFNWLAGAPNAYFGYEAIGSEQLGFWGKCRNLLKDQNYYLQRYLYSVLLHSEKDELHAEDVDS